MIANIFGPDLGIVLVIILLVVVFGSQLPKIARNVGMAGKRVPQGSARSRGGGRAGPGQQGCQRRASRGPATGSSRARSGPASAGGRAPREESVTLTRSELDALLRAREEQAKRDSTSSELSSRPPGRKRVRPQP